MAEFLPATSQVPLHLHSLRGDWLGDGAAEKYLGYNKNYYSEMHPYVKVARWAAIGGGTSKLREAILTPWLSPGETAAGVRCPGLAPQGKKDMDMLEWVLQRNMEIIKALEPILTYKEKLR